MMIRGLVVLGVMCACDGGASRERVDADAGPEVGKADDGDTVDDAMDTASAIPDGSDPSADGADSSAIPDGSTPDVPAEVTPERIGLEACQGDVVPLAWVNQLPYAEVGVGATRGWFLVDWGTTGSAIDPHGFAPFWPAPLAGTNNRWADFWFFGPWGNVTLSPQDFSAFGGDFPQAGILGTDFLALNTFVVDWDAKTLARAAVGAGCAPDTLSAAGFAPLSTRGYFASDLQQVDPGVPNIPTIPVRIGSVVAPAQIDTGYDDALVGPAININLAFYQATADALERASELDLVLTTCVPGLVERVMAYRLTTGEALALVGEDDAAVQTFADAIVFVKDTPSAARHCGGIGTWSVPAGQLAVSFVARGGRAVFEPGTSRVWLPRD